MWWSQAHRLKTIASLLGQSMPSREFMCHGHAEPESWISPEVQILRSCWALNWHPFSAGLAHMQNPEVMAYSPRPNDLSKRVFPTFLCFPSGVEVGLRSWGASLVFEDLKSWNMTHSRYPHHFGPGGPDVSADLVTTAVDYGLGCFPSALSPLRDFTERRQDPAGFAGQQL